MCGSKDNDGPKTFHGMAGPRPGDRRPGESTRDFYDRQNKKRGPRGWLGFTPTLLVLTALACGGGGKDSGPSKEDQRRDLMKGDPFKRWDTDPRGHQPRRPSFMIAPILALTALACGKGGGGDVPPEGDDPMHHRLRRELGGKHDQERGRGGWSFASALPALIVACDSGGKPDGPVFRLRAFTADAVDILAGPTKGGRFLEQRDLSGWARYVFLDVSPERHPYNCRYKRTVLAIRRLGAWPPA